MWYTLVYGKNIITVRYILEQQKQLLEAGVDRIYVGEKE